MTRSLAVGWAMLIGGAILFLCGVSFVQEAFAPFPGFEAVFTPSDFRIVTFESEGKWIVLSRLIPGGGFHFSKGHEFPLGLMLMTLGLACGALGILVCGKSFVNLRYRWMGSPRRTNGSKRQLPRVVYVSTVRE